MTRDFEESSEVLKFLGMARRAIRVVWQPPSIGWTKCNVDGASKGGDHGVGCGGVFRDSIGKWILGFTLKLIDMGILSAELCSILKGLELAWVRDFQRLVVESDLREAIELIRSRCATLHLLEPLIRKIHALMNRNWEVVLSHTYREGNMVAKRLASTTRSTGRGWQLLEDLPEELRTLLQSDLDSSGLSVALALLFRPFGPRFTKKKRIV